MCGMICLPPSLQQPHHPVEAAAYEEQPNPMSNKTDFSDAGSCQRARPTAGSILKLPSLLTRCRIGQLTE
jgi:hypothetical protein